MLSRTILPERQNPAFRISADTENPELVCSRTRATRRGGASEGAPTRRRTAGHHAVAGMKTLPSVPLLPKAPKWLTCSTESNGKAVLDSSSPVDRLRSWIF